MKNHLFHCIMALLCMLQAASCTRTIECNDGLIRVGTVGFNKTDFDSAIIIKYKPDGTFNIATDSTRRVMYSLYRADTADVAAYAVNRPDSMHPYFIVPRYDYKIILPAVGRTITLTNIKQTGQTQVSYSTGLFGNNKLVRCTNSVVSVSVDGNPVFAGKNIEYISLYLVK